MNRKASKHKTLRGEERNRKEERKPNGTKAEKQEGKLGRGGRPKRDK